jgi:hypothetical protein
MAAKFDPKAKAKKQKIIAAVLGVVLIGVLAWQVPSLLKTLNKKPPSAATPAPAPVPGAPPGTVPVTPAPGTPVAVSTGTLVDSDPAAQPAGGQLVSFDRFVSKDPFAQQLGEPAPRPAPGKASRTARTPAATPPAPPPPPPQSATRTTAAATSARIAVNGVPEQVGVGGSFPQADPLFVLVSLTATTAKVGISGGSLDTGSAAVTLKKGKKLTLQNTVDGARYDLLLVATS